MMAKFSLHTMWNEEAMKKNNWSRNLKQILLNELIEWFQ